MSAILTDKLTDKAGDVSVEPVSRPIFKVYPELANVAAISEAALLPTPVEKLSFSEEAWIKRDDITHAEYGGNKIRKLEFIIADAKRRGAKRIVTFGAIGTNHGVATAMMCQRCGLECVVYLFDQPTSTTVQQNLKLMHAYGAKLIYKGSLFKTVLAYYLSSYRAISGSYFLFAGGSNLYGTLSFVNAAFELKEQIDKGECTQPKVIICPVGSSATLAGLTYGFQLADLDIAVIGVRVAPEKLGPFAACTIETVYQLMKEVYAFLNQHISSPIVKPTKPILDGSYYGDGYGVATKKGQAAIDVFQQAGIKLEQTYSAKAAAAFMDQLHEHQVPTLFWDTYNSRDMSAKANTVKTIDLPGPLQRFLA